MEVTLETLLLDIMLPLEYLLTTDEVDTFECLKEASERSFSYTLGAITFLYNIETSFSGYRSGNSYSITA